MSIQILLILSGNVGAIVIYVSTFPRFNDLILPRFFHSLVANNSISLYFCLVVPGKVW